MPTGQDTDTSLAKCGRPKVGCWQTAFPLGTCPKSRCPTLDSRIARNSASQHGLTWQPAGLLHDCPKSIQTCASVLAGPCRAYIANPARERQKGDDIFVQSKNMTPGTHAMHLK